MIGGRVLDPTAVVDAASGRSQYARALIATAVDLGIVLAVPSAALAQAWVEVDPAHHPFLELLTDRSIIVIDDLDARTAQRIGHLGRRAWLDGTFDLAAVHAVDSARTRGWPIVTARPDTLRAIDPDITVEELPG